MPLSNERVPNKPLTGAELKEYVLQMLRARMDADCVFGAGVAYPRVAFTISVKFHFTNPHQPKYELKLPVRPNGAIEGEPPLKDVQPEDEQVVTAFERSVEVDNPNLVRVHAGLPITVTAKIPAAPGEIFNRVEQREVKYDPEQYPKPDSPVDVDRTVETAKEWGLPAEDLREARRERREAARRSRLEPA